MAHTDLPRTLWILKTGDALPPLRAVHGDFEDWIARGLAQNGNLPALPVRTLDARTTTPWPAMEGIAGVVVTGSPAMVTDREPWSERAAAWLAQLVDAQVPVLGLCYGHQLLAHALGGEVARHPGGLEIGTVAIQQMPAAEGDALFGDLPIEFAAHVVHEQSVRRLPPGAVALAANAHEAHHAFRVGPSAWGVQFHPEFSDGVMRDYVQCFAPSLRRTGVDADALQHQVQPTPHAGSLLARFAQLAAAHR
jgi:GMP synthase (glutamine-hydrolysing)